MVLGMKVVRRWLASALLTIMYVIIILVGLICFTLWWAATRLEGA